ncbi:hypothetical protein AAVH_09640 [Aphelenchoides avenae]|nr:hypothetical protein AAVH_09640 [Aphelenchus avenae]
MFAEIDEDTRELAVAHLVEAGQIPLVVENAAQSDRMTIFVFKNEISGETMSLKLGVQTVEKTVMFGEHVWARFKRLPEAHAVNDLIYD